MSTKQKNKNGLCVRDFRKAFAALRSAMPPKNSTNPILLYLKIRCDGETVRITSTDFDKRLTITLDGAGDGGKWESLIERDTVAEAIKGKGSTNPMSFEREGMRIGDGVYPYSGMDPEDFPADKPVKEGRAGKLPVGEMVRCLRYASDEEARYVLNGVYINPETRELVATDGKRMLCLPSGVINPDQPALNIPRDTCKCIEKVQHFLPDVADLEIGNNHAFAVVSGHVRLVSKTIDGNYPNHRHVFDSADITRYPCAWEFGEDKDEVVKWLRSHKKETVTLVSREVKEGGIPVIKLVCEIHAGKNYKTKICERAFDAWGNADEISFDPVFLADMIEDADMIFLPVTDKPAVGCESGIPVNLIMPLRVANRK